MTGVPRTYDKSFNMVPAAALLNLELAGGGWFDITSYTGHTIRFHCENNCPNGGTIDGNVITNTFTDYKADPAGYIANTPGTIVMIDPHESGMTGKWGTNIAQVINGPNGFGGALGINACSVIAIAYDDNFASITPAAYNLNHTAYSISDSTWSTIVTHLENTSTSQPTGDGFVNTDLNSGVHNRVKILLIQNNPVKVNNTTTNQWCYIAGNPAIHDGNLPITYGQASNGDLLFTGENPTAFVGGKCEMIKTHLPLRTLDGFYNQNEGGLIRQPRNIVKSDGTAPVGVLNSGVAYNGYIDQYGGTDTVGGMSVVKETAHIRNGATWSTMSPDD